MKMEQTEGSETSAYKIQTPGNYPVESIQHSISVTKTDQLRLYRELMAVCSQINTKHINTLCGQNVVLYLNTQSVPRSKHTPSRL